MGKWKFQNCKKCYICGTEQGLHLHHIYYGTANRQISDKHGFTCYLCGKHHNLSNESIHSDIHADIKLKKACQEKFEETHTRAQFMELIGINYLDDFYTEDDLFDVLEGEDIWT